MKFPEFLKKTSAHLVLFYIFFFSLPYLAPLIQQGESDAHSWSFWPARILFVLCTAVLLVQILLPIKSKAVRICTALLLWMAVELLIMFEAFMLCFVGHSFDQSFLMHFNLEAVSLKILKSFWVPIAVVFPIFFAAAAALALLAKKIDLQEKRLKFPLVLLLGAGVFFIPRTPFAELAGTIIENIQASQTASKENAMASVRATPGKNLVFIVVESLEQNYLSDKHFPELIPNIKKWMNSEKSLVFENLISVPRNTFEFLFQSHTGNYMHSLSESDHADKQPSLSGILKKAGYNTSFLKSYNLDFAGTGSFVQKVQYDKRMDWQTPEIKAQATELGAWGFRDYDLFEMAKGEFQKLAAQNKPFCFTLFTVDTHAPDGVLGKKSLSYTAPGSENFPLLSALHTTDAALGKFIEFIQNSPQGKDTVIVISGDHLAMKSVVPYKKSVQSILGHKKRENLLTFMLNGKVTGKVTEKSWPVDLAPTILYQMGVQHNANFPSGVNILTEKNAPPRKKLSFSEYSAQLQKKQIRAKVAGLLDSEIKVKDDGATPTIEIGSHSVKSSPLVEKVGSFIEIDSEFATPTSFKSYLTRNSLNLFKTNVWDRKLCYLICTHKKTLFHFIFGEENREKMLLGLVVNGWYKLNSAEKFSELKLTGLNTPQPRIIDAKVDVTKDMVTLKKNGWSLPFFSKTNTYIAQCAIAGIYDSTGKETIKRMYLKSRNNVRELYDLLKNKKQITVVVPPDSPLHKKYGIPENQMDKIMRLHITPEGKKTEMISIRKPGEFYIRKAGKGEYVYTSEGGGKTGTKLQNTASAADFEDDWCCAVTLDAATGKIISQKSFRESAAAVKLMLNRKKKEKVLLICGKESAFLKKYYPALAQKAVLFSITGSRIRHALQYSNGNFRIPEAGEPLDTLGETSARLAEKVLIVSWGNASFVMKEEALNAVFSAGQELVIKLQQHDPADFVFFTVNNPVWLREIARAWKTDFVLLGNRKSKFPQILQQKHKSNYYMALSRGLDWEFFWSDKLDFSIASQIFKNN